MSIIPGKYGGYGVRPPRPGSASRMVEPIPEGWKNTYARAEKALAEPFRGVTTDGQIVPGLFSLQQTGVSTKSVKDAADAFVGSLTAAQKKVALHPIDSQEWRKWTNWEQYPLRHGVSLDQMSASQRDAALELLRASLSVRGFDTARNVMKLNELLGEITGNWEFFGEWLYFLCIFGAPSRDEPWGWQIDGHHLNLSYFVLKDQVVMTPAFWGAEPAIADRGPHAGLREFDAEQRNGLELMRALSRSQQEQAILFRSIISTDLPPERYTPQDGRQQAVSFRDNAVIPCEGISAEALTPGQRYLLLTLIQTYTSHLRPGHDQVWMEEIKQYLPETRFAWMGGFGDNDVFYYKVHSPALLIEFDMHKGVFLNNDEPEKFHIHVVVRTPNGNDYGKDLLRQHLERFHRQSTEPF